MKIRGVGIGHDKHIPFGPDRHRTMPRDQHSRHDILMILIHPRDKRIERLIQQSIWEESPDITIEHDIPLGDLMQFLLNDEWLPGPESRSSLTEANVWDFLLESGIIELPGRPRSNGINDTIHPRRSP